MSIIPSSVTLNLQFYLSGPLPCPYLSSQIERKLFTRLEESDGKVNADINSTLCRAGFRRSHNIVYRPACTACNACIPVRIPTQLFKPSRSLKRVQAQNRDLKWLGGFLESSDELFDLFSAYQKGRHSDSDMARMSENDFLAMLKEGHANTHLYQLRDQEDALKGCVIADYVGDGISAVYSFFAPDMPKRSLGTALILFLIEEAQLHDYPFVYLGYWVAESPKMAYKSRFKPLQCLGSSGWKWLDQSE